MAESFRVRSKAPDNSNPSTAVEPKSESNGTSFVFEAATTEQKPSSFDQSSTQQQKSSAGASDSNLFAGIQLKPESNGASFVFEDATKTEQKPFSLDQSSTQQQKSSADAPDSNPFAGIQLKPESNGASFVFEAATTEQKPSIEDINTSFFKAIQDNWNDGNYVADLSSFMAQYIHKAEKFQPDKQDEGGDGDSEDENGNNSAGQFSGES